MVQSVYKGYKCRQSFREVRKACITIQSMWRVQKAKRVLQMLKDTRKERAAEIVSKTVLAFHHYRKFQKKKQATLFLQKNWRMLMAKRQVESLRLLRLENAAALCIQNNYRAHKVRQDFLHLKKCVVMLQTYCRCFLARQEFNRLQTERKEQERAACILQAFVRGAIQRRNFLRVKNAASILQGFYHRNLLARQEQQEWAATVIQSAFKGCYYYRRYQEQKEAVVVIQDWFRRSKVAREERLKFVKLKSSVIKLQSYFRMKKERRAYLRKLEAVVKIQAFYRRIQAEDIFHLKRNAALILQMYFRAWKMGRVFRQAYFLIRNSCIVIQRFYRKEKMRREEARVVELNHIQNEAAARIQVWYTFCKRRAEIKKLKEEMVRRKKEEKCKNKAASVIQMVYKNFKLIKEARLILVHKREERRIEEGEERRRREKNAALVIQRSWKHYRLIREEKMEIERLCEKERRKNDAAATVIQQFYKQFKLIQEAKIILDIKKIQRSEEERRGTEKLETSAKFLQQVWRNIRLMREAKLLLKELKEKKKRRLEEQEKDLIFRNQAVTKCQSWYRMVSHRNKYTSLKMAVLFCQRRVRSIQRGNLERREMERWHAAAITIQIAWRATKKAKEAKMVLERLKENTGIITKEEYDEKGKRRAEGRKDYSLEEEDGRVTEMGKMKEEEKIGVREEQVEWARMKNEGEIINQEDDEILSLSAGFDHEEALQDFLDSLEREDAETAAIVIQKYIRGYCQRREYLKTIQAIIVAQSRVRMVIQRRKFVAFRASVFLVQQRWRERNMCHQLREEFLSKTAAVRSIQTWYRRVRRIKKQTSAIKIQALWRGYIVRHRIKCKKLKAARKRLLEANSSGNKNTLGVRTMMALEYLLANNDMAYILNALMNLEVSTRLSWVCCERLVQAESAVGILVKLLSSCNRSIPHMEIIKYTTDILHNLAKYDKTVDLLMEVPNITAVVLNIMQIYREKGAIFYKSCALLGILAQDPRRRQILLACPHIRDRVQSLHALALRKHHRNNKGKRLKMPAKSTSMAIAAAFSEESDDPLTAINFVMNSLQLDPKG